MQRGTRHPITLKRKTTIIFQITTQPRLSTWDLPFDLKSNPAIQIEIQHLNLDSTTMLE